MFLFFQTLVIFSEDDRGATADDCSAGAIVPGALGVSIYDLLLVHMAD